MYFATRSCNEHAAQRSPQLQFKVSVIKASDAVTRRKG